MKNKLTSLLNDRRFVLYVTIGLTGVALDFIIFAALVHFGVSAAVASFISVSIAIINNFILNRQFNFKRKDHTFRRFISFYAVGFTGVILSVLLIFIIHSIFGLHAIIAKLFTIPFIVIFQYWFNKNASFASNYKSIPVKEITLFFVCLSVMALFALNGPYHSFSDEDDNLLGAQFIASGQGLIYKDYFSHHMPLTYFVTAPLFVLFGTKLVAIKVAFGLIMSAWLLVMSRHLLKKYGTLVFSGFTLLIALTQMLTWSNMVLAETLIAFALVHAIILFITREKRKSNGDIITLLVLGCIPVLSALPYATISILMYVLALFMFIERYKSIRKKVFIPLALVATLLPYFLLLGYILPTHSFSEMKEQTLTFNTLYYSQFSSSAAKNAIDAGASILQGSVGSFVNSITLQPGLQPQPLMFLFALGMTVSGIVFILTKKYTLAAILITASLFAAGRYGFTSVFTNDGQARSGTVVAFIGILFIILAIHTLLRLKHGPKERNVLLTILCIPLVLLALVSINLIATTTRDYVAGNNMVHPIQQPGSSSTIINLVARPSDYYWLGPLDFNSQMLIKAKNASSYRFYAPWHGVCKECTDDIAKDFATKKPLVISLNQELSIWNNSVKDYSAELVDSFKDKYYTLSDPRLKHTYFRIDDRQRINSILSKTGYKID